MRAVLAVVLLVVAAALFVVVQLVVRSTPPITATDVPITATISGAQTALVWPSQGEAAIGVEGAGPLDSSGPQTATPLASVTKLMTAYLVLHDHPLSGTSNGPDIPITTAAVSTYEQDVSYGDSVVPVVSGEQLTERQALEALLIPSGDNIATLLATWDAGSEAAFVAKMNSTATQLGLTDTHYADASGVAPGSQSNAESQVRLAIDDMENSVFKSIVDMAQVTLPIAGVQYNVDAELGKNGIVGIKTGYTTSAGGCFVFAANATVDGKQQTVVGAVLHQLGTSTQPSALTSAFDASTALLASATAAVHQATVVHAGQVVGRLSAPWTKTVSLETTRSVTMTGLAGQKVTSSVVLPSSIDAPLRAHEKVGKVVLRLGDQRVTVPLETSRALPPASLTWRLSDL
ncbi:MAG: D-alanyl-D-alanine carboxypeptidase family protein [Acidimicrobiales bacterium]